MQESWYFKTIILKHLTFMFFRKLEMSKSCKGLATELVKCLSESDCVKALRSLPRWCFLLLKVSHWSNSVLLRFMFLLYASRLRIDHIKIVQERRALPYQMSVRDLEKLILIAREARHVLVFLLLFIPFDFFMFYS